ncbi:MAG: apolipoprotein N-acyltransferase [Candidatus Omnitrophota bacterium]
MLKHLSKNSYLLAVLGAILLRLAFPKFDFWILAWCAFVPVFFGVENRRFLKLFSVSFLFGFLFFASTIFWLNNVTWAGMAILSIYLGFFIVLFFFVYAFAARYLNYWQRLTVFPAFWVGLEYLRGCFAIAFPWGLLGYSQAFNLSAIQAADIFGVFGVSFIVMFVNIFIFEVLRGYFEKKPLRRIEILVPILIVVFWFSYGVFRIYEDPKKTAPLKVSVIQGNISQDIKWVFSLHEKIFEKYKILSEIVILGDNPDLVVWPETSFPDYLEFGVNDSGLKDFAKASATYLLAGSIRLEDVNYFNSALFFSPEGQILGTYDKIHLVPFGEYIPARKSLPWIERFLPIEDFTAGSEYKIFSVVNQDGQVLKFGVLMCFEDIFYNIATSFVQHGADFLVNMTNDAWFGDTSSPYQHMQASIFRAVENRVYCLRAANAGISCFIDDTGRVVSTVADLNGKETFVTGSKTHFVYKTARRSLYPFFKDYFIFLCVLYAILTIFYKWRRLR